MIPRTQRVQSEQLRVLPPAEFAPLLIEKLERVKREQENKERLERRLAEVSSRCLFSYTSISVSSQSYGPSEPDVTGLGECTERPT